MTTSEVAEIPPNACQHYEVCRWHTHHDGYCFLHWPNPNKETKPFQDFMDQYLKEGRSDFRFIQFPLHVTYSFAGKRFLEMADFRGIKVYGALNLEHAQLPHGVEVEVPDLPELNLTKAVVGGPVEINVVRLTTIKAYGATFADNVAITVREAGEADLRGQFDKDLTLRGEWRAGVNFDGATISQLLDLKDCFFHGAPSFSGTTVFKSSARIDLRRSTLEGIGPSLTLDGRTSSPAAVYLAGTVIKGFAHFEADVGAQKIRIIARNQPPRFHGGATFSNVDLSDCRLVGNAIPHITFAHVKWPRRWFGPRMLYDEKLLSSGLHIPEDYMQGAYEALKQAYQTMGNHAAAGDFHYGELEMRRLEYGRFRRFLCPEFLYWLLNGHGIGYIRAFLLLLALVFAWAVAYRYTNPSAFDRFGPALLYSVEVTTLQKPAAAGLSESGHWLQVAQTILGPVQIALFALALRMRLKR